MVPKSHERNGLETNRRTSDDRVGEFMPQHQDSRSNMTEISSHYHHWSNLRRPGVADLLARQQEEYDEYLVGGLRTKRQTTWLDYGLRSMQRGMLSLRRVTISDPNTPIGPKLALP